MTIGSLVYTYKLFLKKMKIHGVATVRPNILRKCCLMSYKAMKTQGRGTHQETVTIVDDVEIRITKRYANKDVPLY